MLAVLTLSFALHQYRAITISASDLNNNGTAFSEQIAGTPVPTISEVNSDNNPNTDENATGNTSGNSIFTGVFKDVDTNITAQLGDHYLMIRKPLGSTLAIKLDDLYITESLKITISGVTDNNMDSSQLGRVNGSEVFIGDPQYTEITSTEINSDGVSEPVVTKDFGNDIVHGITITNQLDNVSGLYTEELLVECDNVYVQVVNEDINYYYISLKKPKDVYDKVLVIDAGHGGKDAGAIAADGATYEKNVNLQMLLDLKELLDKENIKVYYTRTGDDKVFLRPRVNLANSVDCDFFISIHCNANEVSSPNGTEILYYDNKYKNISDKDLANIFSEELAKTISLVPRGLVEEKGDSVFIMNNAVVPSVLIEVGYVTNNKDLNYLLSDSNRKDVAKGIYNGIMRAYKEYKE